MTKKSVVFFGSFLHYSTKVLEALVASPFIDLVAVVTTPPAPVGKNKVLKSTHTHEYAKQKGLTVFSPEDLFSTDPASVFKTLTTNSKLPSTLQKNPVDFFVVAGYGKLLPDSWLSYPKIASLNLHFSLLPDYRGANPAEWAILLGETETGVTMIHMNSDFDHGNIITRQPLEILETDVRETLYEKLYDLAGRMACDTIPHLDDLGFANSQGESDKPYASRFNRSHGFIDWQFILSALKGKMPKDPPSLLSHRLKIAWQYLHHHPSESQGIITPKIFLDRAVRALSGFPGVWTYLPTKQGKIRLKILSTAWKDGILTLDQIQLEGKNPARFNEIKNQIV